MQSNKRGDIIAGVLIGAIAGMAFYNLVSCAPYLGVSGGAPEEVRITLLLQCLYFGVIPGAAIGFIGGLTITGEYPIGILSRNVGGPTWLFATVAAWIVELCNTASGMPVSIGYSVFMTFISLVCMPMLITFVGGVIERMFRN